MKTKIKTAPATEPVTLEEVKRHLRLAVSAAQASGYSEEDEWFTRSIAAARRMVEQELGRVLITQTWYVYLDKWPSSRFIELPYPPLASATVKYRLEDDSGYDNTFSDVIADLITEPGRVVLAADEYWPTGTLYPVNPIQVEFGCGYGAASAVPSGIKSAILLKLSDLHEERGETLVGPSFKTTGAMDSLLQQYRMWGPK
jgi:uncharacterized phiE125 gp8 family phage protein